MVDHLPEGYVPAMARRFLTLPNTLTLLRLVSAPVFLAVWFGLPGGYERACLWACLLIACASELSDLLDGHLARRRGQVSTFGKLMDPYADSVFRLTAFLCFASHIGFAGHIRGGWYPLWMPILLVLRDIGASIVRTFSMEQGVVVAAKASGKIKAVAQGFVMISLLVIALARTGEGADLANQADFIRVATILMAIVLAAAYWALAEHLARHISVFRRSASH